MVDIGARAVHGGLRTLRAQALRVGTCAQGHQADVLVKHANTLPLNNQSLFGGDLSSVVAKAASSAEDYSAIADGFIPASAHCPKPCGVKESHKRGQEMPALLIDLA